MFFFPFFIYFILCDLYFSFSFFLVALVCCCSNSNLLFFFCFFCLFLFLSLSLPLPPPPPVVVFRSLPPKVGVAIESISIVIHSFIHSFSFFLFFFFFFSASRLVLSVLASRFSSLFLLSLFYSSPTFLLSFSLPHPNSPFALPRHPPEVAFPLFVASAFSSSPSVAVAATDITTHPAVALPFIFSLRSLPDRFLHSIPLLPLPGHSIDPHLHHRNFFISFLFVSSLRLYLNLLGLVSSTSPASPPSSSRRFRAFPYLISSSPYNTLSYRLLNTINHTPTQQRPSVNILRRAGRSGIPVLSYISPHPSWACFSFCFSFCLFFWLGKQLFLHFQSCYLFLFWFKRPNTLRSWSRFPPSQPATLTPTPCFIPDLYQCFYIPPIL